MTEAERELDLLLGDAREEITRLQQQLAHANQRVSEMETAYLEQVDLTIRIRNSQCAECANQKAVRERFEMESA